MRTQKVKLALLEQNTGQIPGLPTNPRTWTQSDIDRLAKSLQETPELFEARPIIAVAFQGKYVILGGNLRYDACLKNGDVEVPCFVFPEGTPIEKLKEVVLKDNGSFGAWDFDALANEWDDLPLTDWGVPAWEGEQPKKEEKEAKEDNFDENKDCIKVLCKLGDIWELGEHRLMCGDSIDLQQVKTLMGGGRS